MMPKEPKLTKCPICGQKTRYLSKTKDGKRHSACLKCSYFSSQPKEIQKKKQEGATEGVE